MYYLDPPYVKDTRYQGQKTKEYHHEMTDDQHIELCEFIKTVKGYVILSGYDNEIYNDMLPEWKKISRSALADGAKKRTEILWLNPAAMTAQKEPTLFTQ